MPFSKVKIIVNPNADLGRAWRSASKLHPLVESYGGADWCGTVYPTHASELAQQAGERGYELIIAVGGDGTVHEIVNGLMKLPRAQRPRLAVVPYGTGNDFAYAIGMDKRPEQALHQIFNGSPRPIDIGKVTDEEGRSEYFDNACGIGFDALVTMRTQNFPFLQGYPVFLAAVMQTILFNNKAANFKISTDCETIEERFLMIVTANGPREGGGFKVSPAARPDDSIFNYSSIPQVSRLRMLQILPEVIHGTQARCPEIRMGQFTWMDLEADNPIFIHVDGEAFCGLDTQNRKARIELLHDELEVIWPGPTQDGMHKSL